MFDAIVIGGGIVGASAAYHLAQGGAHTLLVDRLDVGRATDAGAGIITAGTGGLGIADACFELALRADNYYPLLVEQLMSTQAGDTGYARCGLLRVAVDDDELPLLEKSMVRLNERQQKWGVPLAAALQEISAHEARALFPPLVSVQRALYFTSAARVDGRQMAEALIRAARQQGLTVRRASIERLILASSRQNVTGVIVDGETISATHVIIAGGAWTSVFGEQLGIVLPIEPMRGQIIHLALPGTDTTHWPVMEPFHGHYLVCWPDSRVVAGATREHVGFDTCTTAGGVHAVLNEALRVAPGLATAQFREVRVGPRPATPDHLPVLGPVSTIEGVYLATDMGATGLHLGPYSGKLAANWALGKEQEIPVAAYGIERFNQ